MSEAPLKIAIQNAMKDAMRAKDQRRLGTIRLILAAIKQKEIDSRVDTGNQAIDDTGILAVLDKMIKQRRDSLEQYQAAQRQDLADQESFEITIIEEFLPAALSTDEIENLIADAIKSTQANSAKDMGKVMNHLKPQLQGRADMRAVSEVIKKKLENL